MTWQGAIWDMMIGGCAVGAIWLGAKLILSAKDRWNDKHGSG